MIVIIDFIYYYLTKHFETVRTLKFRTPEDHTSYGLGLVSGLYVLIICFFVEYFKFKTFATLIPVWVYVIIMLLFMQLYSFIYVKRGRYDFIKNREKKNPVFNVSYRWGLTLSFSFCALPFIVGTLATLKWHHII
jgi:hypothetical protein